MPSFPADHHPTWDYLILTASNDRQAATYEAQLSVRRKLGRLPEFGAVMVVADPGGRRVGSGGSTLVCLMRVLRRESQRVAGGTLDWPAMERILRGLRILIVHAGGDSRRVPAYGPCGKIFSPIPDVASVGDAAAGPAIATLFDRLIPLFRELPHGLQGTGQVAVTAGDALMLFDPSSVRLDRPGITALGAYATPEAASKHGVFCIHPDGSVRRFLQKPSPADQARYEAIDSAGRAILDLAVMSFDAEAAVAMFRAMDVTPGPDGPAMSPAAEQLVLERGLDLYREISCALGSEATAEHHRTSALASGSKWPDEWLGRVHRAMRPVPLAVEVLAQCAFLHFGTTRQLITSGLELVRHDLQCSPHTPCADAAGDCPNFRAAKMGLSPSRPPILSMNNCTTGDGRIEGADGWVEGCRLAAPLVLAGQNVVIGVDVDRPLTLPRGACLDVIAGRTRGGRPAWFVRCYDISDTFKDTLDRGGTFLGRPLGQWLAAVGAAPEDIWDVAVAPAARSLWDASVFPAVAPAADYRDWLWMFDPAGAGPAEKHAFLTAERYSVAEIAVLADLEAFYQRRTRLRAEGPRTNKLDKLIGPKEA